MVGRSRQVTGPYLDREGKDMAQGGGSLVIEGDQDWKALGHNSAYTFDGRDWLVLHAYETADHYKQKLKVLEMHWDLDAWPVVDRRDLNRYTSELLP
jgi:arabinan endo-1,5-alpha-L-arabinosidase